MQTFTGFEYLLIDVANAFGLDKEIYDERLKWAFENFEVLEELAEQADDFYLYVKAVEEIRKAQRGEASGHLIGFDAVCSGIQILSAMTGCETGGAATGLVDTGKRPDAYTDCTTIMQRFIPWFTMDERKRVKNAVMTHVYGSFFEPVKEFGMGSEEHKAFLRAVMILAPAAEEMRGYLADSWDSQALYHAWKLPDGFDVKVKVMAEKEARIEVDELNHSTFTYYYEENESQEKGVSNIANMTHSVDAYLVRTIQRRCNYDRPLMEQVYDILTTEALRRYSTGVQPTAILHGEIKYYVEQYKRSTLADVVICPYIDKDNVTGLELEHINKLIGLLEMMLSYQPFPVITVHDEFKCHANNMNYLRYQYKEILAEIAESNLIDDLMSQIYKQPMRYQKKTQNLAAKIRQSNYAIC